MSDLPAELIGPGANGTVHFSGIVAATGQGEAVAKGDAAGQIRCVLRTLERLLAEEGMSFANLVRAPDQTPLFNIIPGSDTDLFATTAMGFEDDNVSGKIGLDYDLSDTVMLYASYSHGYRGAAFNGQARAALKAVSRCILSLPASRIRSSWLRLVCIRLTVSFLVIPSFAIAFLSCQASVRLIAAESVSS